MQPEPWFGLFFPAAHTWDSFKFLSIECVQEYTPNPWNYLQFISNNTLNWFFIAKMLPFLTEAPCDSSSSSSHMFLGAHKHLVLHLQSSWFLFGKQFLTFARRNEGDVTWFVWHRGGWGAELSAGRLAQARKEKYWGEAWINLCKIKPVIPLGALAFHYASATAVKSKDLPAGRGVGTVCTPEHPLGP